MSRIATTTDVLLALIIAGLAAARVHRFLAADTLTSRFRVWLVDKHPQVFHWVSCGWCSGFWYAAALYLLVWFWSDAGIWVGLVAASHVAGFFSMIAHSQDDGWRYGGDS